MKNIKDAFRTVGNSVYEYYQAPAVGLYIPIYQREYSWDTNNIEQLLEDITKGIEALVEAESKLEQEEEIRFLGTIITVTHPDKYEVNPIDPSGLPSRVDLIIDGQQRLTTISLFSAYLYHSIQEIEKKLPKNIDPDIIKGIEESCSSWKKKLINIFSFDLGRGTPERKPKIIRETLDYWTMDESIDHCYKSAVSNYLAKFINYTFNNNQKITLGEHSEEEKKLKTNLNRIQTWIKKNVLEAHINENDEESIKPAWKILATISQEHIWDYNRPMLAEMVTEQDANDRRSVSSILCSLIQIFSVCHYLLERCCFTVIQPSNIKWAFDMFQSLNATGTPLTAIETFKPNVVFASKTSNNQYKGSKIEKYFSLVEALIKDTPDSRSKDKLTSNFLTSFRIVTDGGKLPNHFSRQRKWLDDTFSVFDTYEKKYDFVQFFGEYAAFYKKIWLDYSGEYDQKISEVQNHSEGELCSLILLFLIESNHKMAITILARFYQEIIHAETDEDKTSAIAIFIEATKLIGGFYILWRSSFSNAGLDDVYRQFFKGVKGKEDGKWIIPPHNWSYSRKPLHIDDVRTYFQGELEKKGISTKDQWIEKAKGYLKYSNSSKVCKMVLFLVSHDTIPDPEAPGLMKTAKSGTSEYLSLKKWQSKDLKTIEHIAPQKEENHSNWDPNLYLTDALFESIGNLTLLPQNINSSMGNRGWKEKLIYYQHLSEKDQEQLRQLSFKAKSEGIFLPQSTIELLTNSSYKDHINSIVNFQGKNWDSEIVKNRTSRIISITWERVSKWIFKQNTPHTPPPQPHP